MKWYVVENRAGSFSMTLMATAPYAALRVAQSWNPDEALCRVREAHECEIPRKAVVPEGVPADV